MPLIEVLDPKDTMDIVRARERNEKFVRPLGEKEFALVGRNSVLVAVPQVVHFGGFTLNQAHVQRVQILNRSTSTTRLHLLVPTESPFHVHFERKGNIYAGLSEELTITFTPTEYKYYYDCIKVHSPDGNFIIPLHGYPVVNKAEFPSTIHFGTQPLGHVAQRMLSLSCSVPIEFEFRIEVVKEHNSIVIQPLNGVIPANGSVQIAITFQPIILANVSSDIILYISQFNFKPKKCTILGASAPGITPSSDDIQESKVEISPAQPTLPQKQPYTGPTKPGSKPKKVATEPEEISVDGLKIPKQLDGVQATNFILTQQIGKFKPKDLKKAIDENRVLRKHQKAEQEALRQKTGSAGGRLSFEVIFMEESVASKPMTRQLKELVFLQELQEINKIEKELEFQSNREYIGDILLKPENIEAIHKIRAFNQAEKDSKEREVLRNTFQSHGASVYSTPPMRAALPAFYTPETEPDYNVYKNDLWAKRKRILVRFVQVASKLIVRLRVGKRLRKIKAWLGSATTRQEVRRMVERDWKLALMNVSSDIRSSGKMSGTSSILSARAPAQYQLMSFPIYIESDSRLRLPVNPSVNTIFHDFNLFPLHVPREADRFGYKPHLLLPIPQYVPLEYGRKMRSGAQHEAGTRAPRTSPSKEEENFHKVMTPEILNWPISIRSTVFCLPPASIRVYCPVINTIVETDPAYELLPRLRTRIVPRTVISYLREALGTVTLGTHIPYMLHTVWHACIEAEDNRALWQPPACAPIIVTPDSAPSVIDTLSDSESDNEDDSAVKIPTMEDADALFQDSTSPPLATLTNFARDDAWLKLDREYKSYRYDLCMQLPHRMADIAQHIKDTKAPFVLEGHGEILPLHRAV
ncbi:hypothetical protein THRCLA_08912 [Thraustotheca clavata]|uniref:Cilia- and flagella-associated protein 221 n=1 Tax=Thraustotheca clavata TaxID=74557 RepID=A0A1V9Z0W8_9STRA|nr:hypothetical protein THRCLA_08912 [Thraustotheca clavata]